jgi:hypothetical protein
MGTIILITLVVSLSLTVLFQTLRARDKKKFFVGILRMRARELALYKQALHNGLSADEARSLLSLEFHFEVQHMTSSGLGRSHASEQFQEIWENTTENVRNAFTNWQEDCKSILNAVYTT